LKGKRKFKEMYKSYYLENLKDFEIFKKANNKENKATQVRENLEQYLFGVA